MRLSRSEWSRFGSHWGTLLESHKIQCSSPHGSTRDICRKAGAIRDWHKYLCGKKRELECGLFHI